MAGIFDGGVEGLGKADGGEQREVGVLGLFLLAAEGMTIDGENAVGVLGDHLAPLIEAEHPGGIAILFGAVEDFGLVDLLGEVLPDHRGQLDPHTDVHLVVAQGNAVFLAPAEKKLEPARPTAKMMRSAVNWCSPSASQAVI